MCPSLCKQMMRAKARYGYDAPASTALSGRLRCSLVGEGMSCCFYATEGLKLVRVMVKCFGCKRADLKRVTLHCGGFCSRQMVLFNLSYADLLGPTCVEVPGISLKSQC